MARPKPELGYIFFPEIREEMNQRNEYEWFVFDAKHANANSTWLLSPKGRKAAMVSGVEYTARHAMNMAMLAAEALTAARNGTLSSISDQRLAEYIEVLERSQGKAVALWGDCLAEQRRRQRTVFTVNEDGFECKSTERDCSID